MRVGIVFLLAVGMTVTTARSDEPIRQRGAIRQRVSPKVLREALALPEFQNRSAELPPPSIAELRVLTDKLRQNGDAEGANLLQRFVREYERLSKQSPQQSTAANEKLIGHVHAFELKLDQLRGDSIFHEGGVGNSVAIHSELARLISSGQAKSFVEPRLIENSSEARLQCFSDGEFLIPFHNGKKTCMRIHDGHSTVDVEPTVQENRKVKLQLRMCLDESRSTDSTSLTPTSVQNSKREQLSSYEMNFGESMYVRGPHPTAGYASFIMIELSPRN